MIKHKFTALIAAGAFLSLGGGAIAQQNPMSGAATPKTPMQHGQMMNRSSASALDPSEKSFLTKSAQDSMYEFASAQLAVQKAQSSKVEQYALGLMQDRATYNKQLMRLARQKKIVLPVELDTQNRTKLARLQALKGEAFDREYIQETAQANSDDVKELHRQARSAKDPQVKAFIAQFLPVQDRHLQLATALKNGGNTAASTGTQSKMR